MTKSLDENINVHDYRQPDYDIDPRLIERWSPRSFLDKDVPDEVLFSLFEAARWAPSSANMQPWRFVIARTKADREKFFPFIFDMNRAWCEQAPVLVVMVSAKEKPDGTFNRTHAFDTGTAWGYLSLEAFRKGLVAHGMGGFDPEKAHEILNVPDNYDIHAVMAIGYKGEKENLSEYDQSREKPSDRRPIQDFVFEGDFGQS